MGIGRIQGYVAFTPDNIYKYQNAGSFAAKSNEMQMQPGVFNVCIPLNLLLGFAEDYRNYFQ